MESKSEVSKMYPKSVTPPGAGHSNFLLVLFPLCLPCPFCSNILGNNLQVVRLSLGWCLSPQFCVSLRICIVNQNTEAECDVLLISLLAAICDDKRCICYSPMFPRSLCFLPSSLLSFLLKSFFFSFFFLSLFCVYYAAVFRVHNKEDHGTSTTSIRLQLKWYGL